MLLRPPLILTVLVLAVAGTALLVLLGLSVLLAAVLAVAGAGVLAAAAWQVREAIRTARWNAGHSLR